MVKSGKAQYSIYKNLLLACFVFSFMAFSFRANSENYSVVALPNYEEMASHALGDKPISDVDFNGLRGFYTQVRHYDPLGFDTIEHMKKLASMASKPDDNRKYAAQIAYNAMLEKHVGNIDVVSNAIYLAERHPGFGNVYRLQKIEEGLIQSIIRSGPGTSLAQAYDILTLGEETALLRALNYDVIDKKMQKKGGTFYGIYTVQSRTDGQQREIFIDMTEPLKFMEKQEAKESQPLNLGR